MSDCRCAFTSTQSTWTDESFADCTSNKGPWAFIYCEACIPGQRVYRCTACFHKFQQALRRRLPELERHQKAKVVRGPELDLLLDADFRGLAAGTALADGHATLELVEAGAEGGQRLYRFIGNCPCCYDFAVPAVRAAMPAGFAELKPVVEEATCVLAVPVVDDTTGLVCAERQEAIVRIVTLGALITHKEEEGFRFRAADPPEHVGYHVVWQPPQWPQGSSRRGQRWTLLRSAAEEGEEPKALSLVAWRRLDGVAVEHDVGTVGAAFLECLRDAAGYHRSGPSRDNLVHGADTSIVDSCIRVNRVGGPFGHLQPGSSFRHTASLVTARAVRAACTTHPAPIPMQSHSSRHTPQVSGAIPRRPVAAIVVALQQVSDDAIVAVAPFYIGVAGGRNARAVTPRHHGVPRRGWVGPGRLLDEAIRRHPLKAELLTLSRRFTATTYNGAFLLRALAEAGHPASVAEAESTISNYERNLVTYSTPPSLAAMATRSQHICPFVRGERVFCRVGDEWYEARVRMIHRDGTLAVQYADPTLHNDDPDSARKAEADVRPDVVPLAEPPPPSTAVSAAHPKAPEEDQDDCPSSATEQIAGCRETDASDRSQDCTFLDRLGMLGEYTALMEAIFGHEDHFGHALTSLIENKFLIPRGPTDGALRLAQFLASGAVPPGGLAMPRYKGATVIGAMQDVELHELHHTFHGGPSGAAALAAAVAGGGDRGSSSSDAAHGGAGSSQQPSQSAKAQARRNKRKRLSELKTATYTSPRACWFRDADDADGRCHLYGIGIADWDSRAYYS